MGDETEVGDALQLQLQPAAWPGNTRVAGVKKWLAKPNRQAVELKLTIDRGLDGSEPSVLMTWAREEVIPALAEDIVAQLEDSARDSGAGKITGKLTQHAEDGRVLQTKALEWRALPEAQQEYDGSQRAWSQLMMRSFENNQRILQAGYAQVLQQMANSNTQLMTVLRDITKQLRTERAEVSSAREETATAMIERAQLLAEHAANSGGDAEANAAMVKEVVDTLRMAIMASSNQK